MTISQEEVILFVVHVLSYQVIRVYCVSVIILRNFKKGSKIEYK